jgi:hypothetical protein
VNRRSATWYSIRVELFRTGGMAGRMRSWATYFGMELGVMVAASARRFISSLGPPMAAAAPATAPPLTTCLRVGMVVLPLSCLEGPFAKHADIADMRVKIAVT